MKTQFGEEKPIHMNEGHVGGFDWSRWTKYDDRALWVYDGYPILRTLMYGVQNLDKLKVMCWHDYINWENEEWSTSRNIREGLPAPKPRPDLANDTPMPLWLNLWLFRELRGESLKIEAGEGTQVAASYDGKGYSAVILNSSLTPRELTVDFTLPEGGKIKNVRTEYVEGGEDYYHIDGGQLDASRWKNDGGKVTIQAKPLSAYHVRIEMENPTAPTAVAGVEEYFGDKVMMVMNRYQPSACVTVACPENIQQGKRAVLKIAYQSLMLKPSEVEFTFNGKKLDVTSPFFAEIPISLSDVKASNTLTASLKEKDTINSFTIRSAVIAVEK
jgi:hypothetical protein